MGDEGCKLSVGSFLHRGFNDFCPEETVSGRTAFKKKYVSGAAEGEKTDFDLSYAWGFRDICGQPSGEN